MRNFILYNAAGETYKLMTRQRFLYSPAGLGFDTDDTFVRLGNNYAAVESGYAQGKISGNLYFPQPNAYQKYYDFIRFTDNQPLTLAYSPDIGTFYRKVKVAKVDKTELNEAAALDVSVDLVALGPWYRTLTAVNNGEHINGKIYTVDEFDTVIGYTYPYRYGESAGVLRIQSDSYEDSPARLTIFGPVENPTWRHYVNGDLVATGGINANIMDGTKLVIDATTTPYSIAAWYLDNTIASPGLYGLSNFETERFIILKHGSNVITVTGGTQVMIEGQISYASV